MGTGCEWLCIGHWLCVCVYLATGVAGRVGSYGLSNPDPHPSPHLGSALWSTKVTFLQLEEAKVKNLRFGGKPMLMLIPQELGLGGSPWESLGCAAQVIDRLALNELKHPRPPTCKIHIHWEK